MDAVVKTWPKPVRTLIASVGDNPEREGLRDTPKRVIDA